MKRLPLVLITGALLILGSGTAVLAWLSAHRALGLPGVRVERTGEADRLRVLLPGEVLDFTSEDMEVTEVEVNTLPKDTTFARRLYTAPDGLQIMLSVVMMGTDRTSIHKPEYCLTSQAWQILEKHTIEVGIERPLPYALPVREFLTSRLVQGADGAATRWGGVYLFWFVAEDRVTASHYERLMTMTWDLLRTGKLPRWAYISCFATCSPGQERATSERLQGFIAAAAPEFQVATGQPAAP